jgi:hypothetical protein
VAVEKQRYQVNLKREKCHPVFGLKRDIIWLAAQFFLFKETYKRLNTTSDRLHEMWKILAAFKKAEGLPEEQRTNVTMRLIDRLVEMPPLPIKK